MPDVPEPVEATVDAIHASFVRHARECPESLAVHCGGQEYSYSALQTIAASWAGLLRESLPLAGGRVGLFASRTIEAYAGLLATLEAGAAFVPFLHTHPPARLAVMATLAELDAIIADEASLPALHDCLPLMSSAPLVLLPGVHADRPAGFAGRWIDRGALECAPASHAVSSIDRSVSVRAETPAYLLFTSGTTGTPKAVCVSHGNVRAFVGNATARFPFVAGDRFSQTYDLTFDPSIFDLFVAWEVGASVHVPRAVELMSPGRFIERHALTVWSSVPSIIGLMRRLKALGEGRFPGIRYSMFCGEGLSLENARAWQLAAPNSVVENLYGPTEATVVCTGYRLGGFDAEVEVVDGKVPIGVSFPGHEVRIVDDVLEAVPPGEAGELCIAGPQVASGYWNAPEQTARAFVRLSSVDGAVCTFYRTGDLVRELPSGNIACLGRVDHQVKILGRRVELGEIESRVGRLPGIDDACAVGWPLDPEGRPTAVAVAVVGEGADLATIRNALLAELPDYMVPKEVLVLTELPLNVNGKVDRHAILQRLADGA